MNRRSFLKALFGFLLATLVPKERIVEAMQIGDILKKMGASTLTNSEQEALRLWGNETQLRNSTSFESVERPRFDRIYAETIETGKPILDGGCYTATAPLTLTSGVDGYIEFSKLANNYTSTFAVDSADGTKINMLKRGNWGICLGTYFVTPVGFPATGQATLDIEGYTDAGVLDFSLAASRWFMNAVTAIQAIPFVGFTQILGTTRYIKIKAGQVTGANANVSCRFATFFIS